MRARRLRVCLDARIPDGTHGGVQQVILGLARGLASLPEGPEEYLFLVEPGQWEWLRPYLVGPCRPLEAPRRPPSILERARQAIRPGAADSDGTVERAGADVVHLTLQDGFRTRLPSIYMPYDLQHVHLPEFFGEAERESRERVYRDLCHQASVVVAISRWGAQDLIRTYRMPPAKVRTVHLAPAVEAYAPRSDRELGELRARLRLPESFALYPARFWPHKNHRNLLEALAALRSEGGPVVPLVLTGSGGKGDPDVRRQVAGLGLADQVTILGFVAPHEIQAAFQGSRLLVFPSLFEGFGMPVLEAFRLGVPVAASRVTCLPEIAGGAAHLFDPQDPRDLARAVGEAWTDPVLRERLVERGRARASAFTWGRTATAFRALYRTLAGRAVDEADRAALAETSEAGGDPVLRSDRDAPG